MFVYLQSDMATASVLTQDVFFLQKDRAVAIKSIFLVVRIFVLDMGK